MKKIFNRNPITFFKRKLFPEYINPNEKLSFEIRKKLLENNVEINGNTIDSIIKSNNKYIKFYLSNFHLEILKSKMENFNYFKNNILLKSLGIDFERKFTFLFPLVNLIYKFFSLLFVL